MHNLTDSQLSFACFVGSMVFWTIAIYLIRRGKRTNEKPSFPPLARGAVRHAVTDTLTATNDNGITRVVHTRETGNIKNAN